MIHRHIYSGVWKVLLLSGVAALLIVCTHVYVQGPHEAVAKNSLREDQFPLCGKLRQAKAPAKALFGMIYINTTNNREYIFDGSDWVPHDNSADDYYRKKDRIQSEAVGLAQDEVLPTGQCGTGTGAHGKHSAFDCSACHYVGGVLCFDGNGPAVAPGKPLPSFDVTSKTCSNISCHGMYSGTFSYYFIGGDGEPVLQTVSYAGSGGSTPSWYSTGAGCSACHGNPPRNSTWHSGYHVGGPTTPSNQCQLCHPDASGLNGLGTAITNPALHANGTVEVQARFTSSCFGCH